MKSWILSDLGVQVWYGVAYIGLDGCGFGYWNLEKLENMISVKNKLGLSYANLRLNWARMLGLPLMTKHMFY